MLGGRAHRVAFIVHLGALFPGFLAVRFAAAAHGVPERLLLALAFLLLALPLRAQEPFFLGRGLRPVAGRRGHLWGRQRHRRRGDAGGPVLGACTARRHRS
uniref:Uncharacterized protein n=1 Tax=Ixodes ricinus TaxID=34613 RepID=A0A6B0U6M3_IXORI